MLTYMKSYRSNPLVANAKSIYFFPAPDGGFYDTSTIYDIFRKCLFDAGIPHRGRGKGPRLHDLRHSFAVHILNKWSSEGKDIYTCLPILRTALGHDRITTTEKYLRLVPKPTWKSPNHSMTDSIPLQRYFAMRNRCSYAGLVSAYFSVYLAGTKNVSTNTIYSYRDTFVIFHGYLEKYCGFKLEKMLFNDLSRELILEFLQYLETERKYSISSRNQRLAALKSFAKYVQIECPDEMILCQRILSIDSKKAAKPTVQYLSNQQTDILMEQPDISTPKGRRDLAMLLLLYDSAARVQELCDLRICDIRIDSLPVVHLLGRGEKVEMFRLPNRVHRYCANTFVRTILIYQNAAMTSCLQIRKGKS